MVTISRRKVLVGSAAILMPMPAIFSTPARANVLTEIAGGLLASVFESLFFSVSYAGRRRFRVGMRLNGLHWQNNAARVNDDGTAMEYSDDEDEDSEPDQVEIPTADALALRHIGRELQRGNFYSNYSVSPDVFQNKVTFANAMMPRRIGGLDNRAYDEDGFHRDGYPSQYETKVGTVGLETKLVGQGVIVRSMVQATNLSDGSPINPPAVFEVQTQVGLRR